MMKIYYCGTNNNQEPALLSQGLFNRSKNYITGELEKGLSVSDVKDVGSYFDYMYIVTGEEIGIGSDGEPLLDLDIAKFIKWIKF